MAWGGFLYDRTLVRRTRIAVDITRKKLNGKSSCVALVIGDSLDTDVLGFWFKEFIDHRDPHLLGPPLRPDPQSYSALGSWYFSLQSPYATAKAPPFLH